MGVGAGVGTGVGVGVELTAGVGVADPQTRLAMPAVMPTAARSQMKHPPSVGSGDTVVVGAGGICCYE